MLRLLILLLVITAVSLGLSWLADEPGRVAIEWSSYHIEASLLTLCAGVAALTFACLIAYLLLFALIRTPRSWMRSRLARRQALGLDALTQAFAAIATQDIVTAKKQIGRAQHYLPQAPLTLMLAAQVARAEGNEGQARLYLEQMLVSEGTEFLAMRSLVENARRGHDDDAALGYAEKALALKPQDAWLITTAIALYCSRDRTQNALQLIEFSARKRYLTKKESRALAAYTLFENARALAEQNRWDFAIAVLEDVLRKEPGFVPGGVLLANAYLRQQEQKRALKVVALVWKHTPHPGLSDVLLRCYDANIDTRKVVYAAEKIAQIHPEHRESQFLMAAMALKRQDRALARKYLKQLLYQKETARACQIMSELENEDGDRDQAAHWLKRASLAAPEPAWTCESCNHTSPGWQLSCSQCGAVATILWK